MLRSIFVCALALALSACGHGGAATSDGGGGGAGAGGAGGNGGDGGVVGDMASASPISLGLDAPLGGYRPFPADNPLNTPIDTLPVSAHSADWIANCAPAAQSVLRLDLSMPYTVVAGDTPTVPVTTCTYGCDPGPWPIPPDVVIEGSDPMNPAGVGDRHVLVLDRDHLRLYEVFAFVWNADKSAFSGGSGVIWDLTSNATPAYGGADAAGLPIMPLLLRADELIDAKKIEHALRFTCSVTQKGYIAPARAAAGATSDPTYPPMGMRVRLKASFDTSSFPASMQPLLAALKKYGLILADNGGANTPWFIGGDTDPRLQKLLSDELYVINTIAVNSAMEVVDSGPVLPQ